MRLEDQQETARLAERLLRARAIRTYWEATIGRGCLTDSQIFTWLGQHSFMTVIQGLERTCKKLWMEYNEMSDSAVLQFASECMSTK